MNHDTKIQTHFLANWISALSFTLPKIHTYFITLISLKDPPKVEFEGSDVCKLTCHKANKKIVFD